MRRKKMNKSYEKVVEKNFQKNIIYILTLFYQIN